MRTKPHKRATKKPPKVETIRPIFEHPCYECSENSTRQEREQSKSFIPDQRGMHHASETTEVYHP